MRLAAPSQLTLFGPSPALAEALDFDAGWDQPDHLRTLPVQAVATVSALRAWIFELCRTHMLGNALYSALAMAFEAAICGPVQGRLVETLDEKLLKKRCLRAVPWISLRGRKSVTIVASAQAASILASDWYIKSTARGALGAYFKSCYLDQGMDPLRNNNLAMAVCSVVEHSRWSGPHRDVVAELLFSGLRFFPYRIENWGNIAGAKGYRGAASSWLCLFGLLSEGYVPLAANETTLVVSS